MQVSGSRSIIRTSPEIRPMHFARIFIDSRAHKFYILNAFGRMLCAHLITIQFLLLYAHWIRLSHIELSARTWFAQRKISHADAARMCVSKCAMYACSQACLCVWVCGCGRWSGMGFKFQSIYFYAWANILCCVALSIGERIKCISNVILFRLFVFFFVYFELKYYSHRFR